MYITPPCNLVNFQLIKDYVAPLNRVTFIFGDIIHFDLSGNYIVPSCNGVNFSFVAETTTDLSINSHDATIQLDSNILQVFSGMMIVPANAELRIISDKFAMDILIPIEISDSQINIIGDNFDLEILPDMIIKNAELTFTFDNAIMKKPYDFNLPFGTNHGNQYGWQQATSYVDASKSMSWGIGEQLDVINKFPIKEITKTDHEITSSWFVMGVFDHGIKCPHIELSEEQDVKYGSSWISKMTYADNHSTMPRLFFTDEDNSMLVGYGQPNPNDSSKSYPWNRADEYDHTLGFEYGAPDPKDAHKFKPWGPFSYYTLCNSSKYVPPKGCELNFSPSSQPALLPGVCKDIVFILQTTVDDNRCEYESYHSGTRDAGPGILVEPQLTYPQAKEMYSMFNTILVSEVVTGKPIEVIQLSAKIDTSSWLWSFSVTIAAKCYLDLIKPIDGVMGHIKIVMNGYEWYCTVEGWNETRAFGSQAWTITGRSPAMMFGDPISQKKNGTETADKQGQTIIEEMVASKQLPPNWPTQFESWTADFSEYLTTGNVVTGFKPYLNWLIPGNTVSFSNANEITTIKELADSVGAYVQASRNENVLKIIPKFNHQPWNWDISNTDINWITMNESQLIEVGRSNELKSYYQAVRVVGESVGASDDGTSTDGSNTAISVEVRRNEYGPSTADYAPMVTSKYVTSSKAGLENGRVILGNTGEWVTHTLRIGVLCPVGGTSFNLFETGNMISVLERGTPWYGRITSVSVVAANAGAGFAIEQVIEVEEYKGE